MTKKYISLEHSIRNVIVESVGVIGSDKYKGVPAGFGSVYSSRAALKGRHGVHSIAAHRDISLRKVAGQAEGGINPGDVPSSAELSARGAPQESGKAPKKLSELNEKVDVKNVDHKDNKSTLKMIQDNPIVKFRSFPDLMTNPDGKAHPPLQPPNPMMTMMPPPQQAMAPREGAIPSTTPGAVATPQTVRKEGGDKEKTGAGGDDVLGGLQQPGADPTHPTHAASHLSAAAGLVQNLSQLLHNQSQTAAATPPQAGPGSQGHNPAPVLNEPNQKNWRDQPGRRSGQTQSQIPGMIQRDQGTHGPDNPGGTHQNPGEKKKGSLGNLMGTFSAAPVQGKAGAQSGPVDPKAPGMPSFQPPEAMAPSWMSKRGGLSANDKSPGVPSFQPPEGKTPDWMSKRGGLSANEKSSGVPSFQPPEKQVPPVMAKGPNSVAAAAAPVAVAPPEEKKSTPQRVADYMDMAGPPPKVGSLHVDKKAPEPDKKAPDKTPDKEEYPLTNRGRRTGNNPENDPESIHRDKGKVPGGPGHTNPGERAKAGMPPVKDQSRLGSPGTQSGGAAERAPRKDAPLNKDNPSAAGIAPATGKEPIDPDTGQPYPKTNRGQRTGNNPEKDPESIHRDKGKVPGGPGHTNPGEKKKSEFPSGGINRRPEPTEADKYRDPAGPPPKGGNLNKIIGKENPDSGRWQDQPGRRSGKTQGEQPDMIQRDPGTHGPDNRGGTQELQGKPNPGEGEKGAWHNMPGMDLIKKYGPYAAAAMALLAMHKLTGSGGGSSSGDPRYKKSDYAPIHIHGHDEASSAAYPGSQTQAMTAQGYFGPKRAPKKFAIANEETEHDNTKERRKIGFIERPHKGTSGTKERRKTSYLERRPEKHDLRHRFSSKTLQGRETIAGMDEERRNFIMREAILEAKAKRKKKTEGGKTPVDTKPMLNPEPLNSLRGP